jgi:lipoprotein-anchoring transpeptidase ErfK/SrfK
MKHISLTRRHCPFCDASLDTDSSTCQNCSPTCISKPGRGIASHVDSETTEAVSTYSAKLYLSAIAQTHDDDDLTARMLASPIRLYSSAIEQAQAIQNDDTDMTERFAARDASRLYRQAIEKPAILLTSEPDPGQPAKNPPILHSNRQTRRRLLSFWHLLVDILLLLALIFVSIATYEQNIQARNVVTLGQAQQQAKQHQAALARLTAEQNAAKQATQLKQEAQALVKQLNQETSSWGKAHIYRDTFDGHQYILDSGYEQAGIGASINQDLAKARTTSDFAAVVSETQGALFNFQMLEANYQTQTPYNQVHKSDLELLQHYQLQQKMVIVVSTTEQVMRVYQQGRLVRAFYVTTGRPERPSLPGVWPVLDRQSPIIFVSGDPPGSPYWFPATPINYAILYHLGGFFLHDAPWRSTFGPGSQFPHQDIGGNTLYNYDGSHGCVNLSEADAAWVYTHTNWNTAIVIY